MIVTKPPFDILPDQCVAEILSRRGQILADYEAALSERSNYDHGAACQCHAAVDHAQFIDIHFRALASGVILDESTIAKLLDSATQLWAWHLLELESVGDLPL